MLLRSRFAVLMFGLSLAACLGGPAPAAPTADPDYETIGPAHALPAVPPPSIEPQGRAGSPLVVTGEATGPRLRFVMRDGTVLVGQVLGFDGQMYALRLAHGTVLVRKDLFKSIRPVASAAVKHPATRVAAGPRS